MDETKAKKTKVLPVNGKFLMNKKLRDLQKAIDEGNYKVDSKNIVKAYLYKENIELNTLEHKSVESTQDTNAEFSLEIVNDSKQNTKL